MFRAVFTNDSTMEARKVAYCAPISHAGWVEARYFENSLDRKRNDVQHV
jgi:hypothetical protein